MSIGVMLDKVVPVIGLTGGIASGKSTVKQCFEKLGIESVCADEIGHALTAGPSDAMAAIEKAFGLACINADGSLNRAWMRDCVFQSKEAKQQLEAILHPLILQNSLEKFANIQSEYAVWEVPLLLENLSYQKYVNRVLVVDVPEDVQVSRLMARNHFDEKTALAILKTQCSRSSRLAAADDIIDNSGSFDATEKQVLSKHHDYLLYFS